MKNEDEETYSQMYILLTNSRHLGLAAQTSVIVENLGIRMVRESRLVRAGKCHETMRR